jgi:hypothetical protein
MITLSHLSVKFTYNLQMNGLTTQLGIIAFALRQLNAGNSDQAEAQRCIIQIDKLVKNVSSVYAELE